MTKLFADVNAALPDYNWNEGGSQVVQQKSVQPVFKRMESLNSDNDMAIRGR